MIFIPPNGKASFVPPEMIDRRLSLSGFFVIEEGMSRLRSGRFSPSLRVTSRRAMVINYVCFPICVCSTLMARGEIFNAPTQRREFLIISLRNRHAQLLIQRDHEIEKVHFRYQGNHYSTPHIEGFPTTVSGSPLTKHFVQAARQQKPGQTSGNHQRNEGDRGSDRSEPR